MSENIDKEYGWDDEIEKDEQETLAEGDYSYTVKSFERGRFNGSEKIPACNMAIITIAIHSDKPDVDCKANLILHSKMEWKLSEFFESIGQKKKGEKIHMNWNKVVGATGRCCIKLVPGKKNPEKKFMQIDKFYAASDTDTAPKFEKGKF